MIRYLYVMCQFELGNKTPAHFHHARISAESEEDAYMQGREKLEAEHPLPPGWGDNDIVIEI